MDTKGRVSETGAFKILALPKLAGFPIVLILDLSGCPLTSICPHITDKVLVSQQISQTVWSVKVVGPLVGPAGSYDNGHNMTIIHSLASLIL